MIHTRLVTAVVAALALLVPAAPAARAATASERSSLLGPNQVTMGDRVPWGQVGHGWYLTLVDQGPTKEFGVVAHHQLLDLVDPLGGRYQLAKTTVHRNGSGYRTLDDWSADGRSAVELVATTSTPRAVVYDLPAGTRHSIDLGKHVSGVSLGPDGSLYETWYVGDVGQSLGLRDADGTVHVLRRHTDGAALTTPDTRQVVVGTSARHDHRLLVLDPSGTVVRSLATPATCQASRWWSHGVVMASCFWHRGTLRLYAAPVDGSAGHWLTADHGRKSADLGDLDARRLDGTTYLEASGPCGVVFLARQHRGGAATEVHVPKATQNVYLVGTRGTSLVLHLGISCDGGGSRDALTHFDPRTGRNRIVALLPVDEQYDTILGFGERRVPLV